MNQFILLSIGIFTITTVIYFWLIFVLFVTIGYINVTLNPLTMVIALLTYLFMIPGCAVLCSLPTEINVCMPDEYSVLCPGFGAVLYYWIGTLIYILIRNTTISSKENSGKCNCKGNGNIRVQ